MTELTIDEGLAATAIAIPILACSLLAAMAGVAYRAIRRVGHNRVRLREMSAENNRLSGRISFLEATNERVGQAAATKDGTIDALNETIDELKEEIGRQTAAIERLEAIAHKPQPLRAWKDWISRNREWVRVTERQDLRMNRIVYEVDVDRRAMSDGKVNVDEVVPFGPRAAEEIVSDVLRRHGIAPAETVERPSNRGSHYNAELAMDVERRRQDRFAEVMRMKERYVGAYNAGPSSMMKQMASQSVLGGVLRSQL